MLCQHLGFHEIDAHSVSEGRFVSGTEIASGDLMCYKEQPSGTSCCVHLEPSTTTRDVSMPFARCEYTACITNNYSYTWRQCLFVRAYVCLSTRQVKNANRKTCWTIIVVGQRQIKFLGPKRTEWVAIMIDLIYWQRYAVSEPPVAYTYSSPLKQTTSRSLSLLLYRQDMRSRQSDTPQLKRHIFWQWF